MDVDHYHLALEVGTWPFNFDHRAPAKRASVVVQEALVDARVAEYVSTRDQSDGEVVCFYTDATFYINVAHRSTSFFSCPTRKVRRAIAHTWSACTEGGGGGGTGREGDRNEKGEREK